LPYLFGFVMMNFWGWHSDHTGERIWHLVAGYFLCGSGLVACVVIGVGHPVLTMIALIWAVMGINATGPIFWTLPTALLTGTAAAGGLGMMNSISNLGGFFGPWGFGLVKDATGSDNLALLCLSVLPFIAIILVLVVGHDRRFERQQSSMAKGPTP
jgi:ACS family tartrate transporter-like MFS transporter